MIPRDRRVERVGPGPESSLCSTNANQEMKSIELPIHLPVPRDGRVDLLIVAAEHSGDEHAARLVRELLAKQPGLAVAALGGPRLA